MVRFAREEKINKNVEQRYGICTFRVFVEGSIMVGTWEEFGMLIEFS
jgi:hypothetical protein